MNGRATVPANYQTECLSILLIPKGIYYKEFVHVIIEVAESHDVQSASWSPRRAGGVFQSESGRLRTRRNDGVISSLRVREDRCPAQAVRQSETDTLLLQLGIGWNHPLFYLASQSGRNLLALRETRVWSLGLEDPLEKEMATHSSIPTWEIPWTEELGGLQPMRLQKSWTQNRGMALNFF